RLIMHNSELGKVLIIGAGLAGSEASMYLAKNGVKVILAEAKTLKLNPAQKIPSFAELVCTNSLKSLDPHSAHGLLKTEMEGLDSFIVKMAKENAVPAGDALAVDREKFSQAITSALASRPGIEIIHEDVSDPLALKERVGADYV